jgi:hypothetical protein
MGGVAVKPLTLPEFKGFIMGAGGRILQPTPGCQDERGDRGGYPCNRQISGKRWPYKTTDGAAVSQGVWAGAEEAGSVHVVPGRGENLLLSLQLVELLRQHIEVGPTGSVPLRNPTRPQETVTVD